MKKSNHVEVSAGGTIIVACEACPLPESRVMPRQVFNSYICCTIQGQGRDFECSYFDLAIFDKHGLRLNCLYKMEEVTNEIV